MFVLVFFHWKCTVFQGNKGGLCNACGIWRVSLQSRGPCGGNAERVSAQHPRPAHHRERLSPGCSLPYLLHTFIPPVTKVWLLGPASLQIPKLEPRSLVLAGSALAARRDGTESLSGIWSWLGRSGDLQLDFTQLASLSCCLSIFLCLFTYNVPSSHPFP